LVHSRSRLRRGEARMKTELLPFEKAVRAMMD